MQIISNGWAPDRLEQVVSRVVGKPVDLLISLSVDEIGDAHDEVRGLPGLFDSLMESYRRLSPMKKRGLSLNANFTLSRRNSERAIEILSKAMDLMPEASFSLTVERDVSARNGLVGIGPQTYARVADHVRRRARSGGPQTYEKFSFGRRILNARTVVLNRTIERTLAGMTAPGRCYAGQLTGVLTAGGDVYPCEVLQIPFGNVRDHGLDLRGVWRSAAGAAVRRSIARNPCVCTYECAWGANVLFDVRYMPRLVAEMAAPGGNR